MDAKVKPTAPSAIRNVQRAAQILAVFARHGWGRFVDRLEIPGIARGDGQEARQPALTDAERFRMALENLGPTFVKFGQLLSVRQDLFTDDVITELRKLQDAVPAFPGEQARGIIESELGRPIRELFAAFDDTPLAAASIAQVHVATLTDGTAAVVKVQRPGIAETIDADIEVLFALARLLERYVPELRHYEPVALVEELAETIIKELDFRLEGQNAERFARNFTNERAVWVPGIHWQLSTRRVLTQERSTGHRSGSAFAAFPEERRRLADTLARVFLTQLFEHGFFHGDPHPGNVFILDDGRLCFHDFGIVGRLSPRDQENLRQLVICVVTRDADAMAELYLGMGVAPPDIDREDFARDLSKSLEQYYAVSEAYSFGEILRQFVRLGQRYRIRMPREWLLVVKAFMVVEAQASTLDPRFSMIHALQEYLPQLLRSALWPEVSSTAGLVHAYRAMGGLRTLTGLPLALGKALGRLERGELTLRMRHDRLEDLERHLDRASNRLSFSMIIAAVVVASSIVFTSHTGPHIEGLPLLGLVGYGIAAVLGLWWAVAILRSGNL